MEKRLLLAIVLSFLVLFVYTQFFVKEPPRTADPALTGQTQRALAQPAPPPVQETEPPVKEETPDAEVFQPVGVEAEQTIIVETSLYRSVWSNKGAVLKSWRLKAFQDDEGEDLDLVSLRAEKTGRYPFSLSVDDPAYDGKINTGLYMPSVRALDLGDGESGEVRFEFADENGNRVRKTLVFTGGKYYVDIAIETWKNGQRVEPRLIWGPGFGNQSTQGKARMGSSSGLVVFSQGKVERKKDELKSSPEEYVFAYNLIRWAAYEDTYFAALFQTDPLKSSVIFRPEMVDQTPHFFMALSHPHQAYLGPKDIAALTELGNESKRLLKFGFFGVIAEILLKTIRSIHGYFPNWGFSIIILTIIIKIIFLPLTISSTRSMAKMQALQPKIKALRAKYKKAKQDTQQRRKMNEEMMKLYKEHGVNPAGGCLPILIQLPIFWGFFQMLRISIEFRQSPFIFWINDLSFKDPFYITPILMGVTQFISQKMTPTSADPTQQRMMMIMPVVMTIFFMNFQSGLVLYWLTNNVLQIAQQYVMNKYVHKKKRETHGKRRKK